MPLILALAALLLMSSVPISVVAEEDTEAQVTNDASLDRRICRRVQVTGSRMKEKICRTERDWDQITEESNETVGRAREKGNNPNQEG